MAHPPMLCLSMSVEGWSGVELLLAGLRLIILFVRHTLSVEETQVILDVLTPIHTALSSIVCTVSGVLLCEVCNPRHAYVARAMVLSVAVCLLYLYSVC